MVKICHKLYPYSHWSAHGTCCPQSRAGISTAGPTIPSYSPDVGIRHALSDTPLHLQVINAHIINGIHPHKHPPGGYPRHYLYVMLFTRTVTEIDL